MTAALARKGTYILTYHTYLLLNALFLLIHYFHIVDILDTYFNS